MAPVAETIEIFEDKAERILWLPVLTLGYIFVQSGAPLDFWLAVFSIGGASVFTGLVELDSEVATEDSVRENGVQWALYFEEAFSGKFFAIALIMVIYVISVIYGLWRLYEVFTHTDPILVALSGIYWGILILILLHS